MERSKFLPEGIHLGRTGVQAIEVAGNKMSLSARVYVKLETGLSRNPDPEIAERAQKVLWRVIRQPKVLKSMTTFYEVRDRLIKPKPLTQLNENKNGGC